MKTELYPWQKTTMFWVVILTIVAILYNDYIQHTPATGTFRWDLFYEFTIGIGASLLILWLVFKFGNWLHQKAKGK